MNDEMTEKPKQEITDQPEAEGVSANLPELDKDTPPLNGSTPKSSNRFIGFLKRLFILLVLLLVVFGAGWLTCWQFKYKPTSDKLTTSEADLQTANQRIDQLENQLATLKGIEVEKQTLQMTLNDSQMHIALLRLLSDINAARLSLEDEDPANARLYLKPAPERLIALGKYLGSEHADVISNMQKRLVLIDTEISSDPATALTDLSVIANNLLQIEGVFFAVP